MRTFNYKLNGTFFAKSHGKKARDGVYGAIKRLAAHASLQCPFSDQILTPRQLFEFAKSNVRDVNSKLKIGISKLNIKPGRFYACRYDND